MPHFADAVEAASVAAPTLLPSLLDMVKKLDKGVAQVYRGAAICMAVAVE
jgi:hypothetical protein